MRLDYIKLPIPKYKISKKEKANGKNAESSE